MLPDASLTPTMFGICGEAHERRRLDVDAGPARHVVDDDRQRRALGDRAVVLVEPFLRRLVVVRRDRQEAGGAGLAPSRRRGESLRWCRSRRRRPGSAALPSASSTRISTIAQPLGVGQRRVLAGRAARDEEMNAGVDLPPAEPPHRRSSRSPVFVNGVTSAVPTPVQMVLIALPSGDAVVLSFYVLRSSVRRSTFDVRRAPARWSRLPPRSPSVRATSPVNMATKATKIKKSLHLR